MAYNYLSDLKGDAEVWVIRVRICRMWDSISTKDNTLLGMDMVLIDEKENLMHAAVRKHLVPRFSRLLTEGLVYNLRNVKVTTNTYSYRPLASNMRVLFLATTGVQELGEDVASIPRPSQGAITFATTSGSRIYVNPDVEHVTSIRERFSALSPKVVAIEAPSAVKLPPEEAMFVNRMSVEALVNATYAGELKVDVLTLKATIIAINNHSGWYYVSCKSCVRKAVPRDGVYICNGCGEPVDFPLALFRVNVQVEDGTGSTIVVLFNSATERLLDASAKKLINKMPPGDTSVPAELQTLLGKELVFKLKLNNYNLVDGLQDYGVSVVYTPVGELESAHAKNALTVAIVNLVDPSADEDNVSEDDNKRKQKFSAVIEDIAGGSGGAA